MIPTFVLNLDRNPERLRFMAAQFAALGLDFTRIRGVDGQAVDRRATAAAPYAPLSVGEVGCFESHRRAWQTILDRGLPAGIVLEDDVAIADDFGALGFAPDLLAAADLIKIDAHPLPSLQGGEERPGPSGRALRRLLGSENSAGGYVITARGARRLLQRSERYVLPADLFLFHQDSPAFTEGVIWKLRPAAVTQLKFQPGEADLHGEFRDGIQARRRGAVEPRPAEAGWTRWRLRLRRLADGDLRRFRHRRHRRFLAALTPAQDTVREAVPYRTGSHAHTEAGLAATVPAPAPAAGA